MYDTSSFKKGLKILMDGQPFNIIDFQHVKPGKGNQFTRTKLKNLLTGSNLEKTFRSGEKFEVPDVTVKDMQFLYQDESGYHFMDQESYDQVSMNEKDVGNKKFYLKEGIKVSLLFFNGRAIDIELPNSMILKVNETDPGLKGNTVSGATKPATLETGLKVMVPLHINIDDNLKIDTSTGKYVERSSK